MKENRILSINKYTKILVPASSYDIKSDNRLLIPYTSGEKIGFINNGGEIIVQPKYSMCYDECYNESDYIRVTDCYPYGFPRLKGKVASYHRPLYGLINYKGEEILPLEYLQMSPSLTNSSVFTVQRRDGAYGVLTANGTEIVPFGKYDWIDGFDHGLARVKIGKGSMGSAKGNYKLGLINEHGEEVYPIEYDNIWNFYGKKLSSTKVEKNGVVKTIRLD